jgi:hypothetical protein
MLGEVPKLFLVSYSDASLDSSSFPIEAAEIRKKEPEKTISEGDLSDPRNSRIGVSKPTKRRITVRRSEKVEGRPKIRKNQEMKRKRWT